MMKESEIRPQDLFNRYLELSRQDIDRFFADRSNFVEVPCPACASGGQEPGLTKSGFKYVSCVDCGSLYLSPRPPRDLIHSYQRESEAIKFFGTHFFKETAEARREKMFKPRAQLVGQWTSRLGLEGPLEIVDVGSGYGIFLEEVSKLNRFARVSAIEPAPSLASVCRAKGFFVIEKAAEEVREGESSASIATCFEVLEHVYDPAEFLTGVRRVLKPGGFLLLTTLTVTGFDIQVLWEHSKSVNPPQHINLLSVSGTELLFRRAGFEVVEVSTPGQLDVDIVRNTATENPAIALPRFVRQIALHAPDDTREAFQKFLQDQKLSSHLRVIARVPQQDGD